MAAPLDPARDSKTRPGLRSGIVLAKLLATVALFAALFAQDQFSWASLGEELRRVELGRFLPWLGLAVLLKLLGIFGNIWRWQLLLRGQDLHLSYRFLCGSFFVGRFFGIVTPGTLGLDGFKLYDSIRATRKPIPCGAVLLIDKLVGLVSLTALLLLVFPMSWGVFGLLDPSRALVVGLASLVAVGTFFAFLLAPQLSRPLLRFVPGVRLSRLAERLHSASMAYASRRGVLLSAVGLAAVGHVTTALMYWSLLCGMSPPDATGPGMLTVLFVALLMTSATLVAPTIGGEGVREASFALLLEGLVPQARSVLFGHAGFWIEKGLLGLPGGVIYLLRKSSYDGPVTREDLERLRREVGEA